MENTTPRDEQIRKTFSLQPTTYGFEALWTRRDGSTFAAITGTDRAKVIRAARQSWGHFNYADEAEAFAEIFPAGVL